PGRHGAGAAADAPAVPRARRGRARAGRGVGAAGSPRPAGAAGTGGRHHRHHLARRSRDRRRGRTAAYHLRRAALPAAPDARVRMTHATPAGRVHSREVPAVAISFAYFFCVLAAYYVMRPVREQLAAAVGSTQLPWFFGATFVATLLLTP